MGTNAALENFRLEVRQWIQENKTEVVGEFGTESFRRWGEKLYKKGWAVPHWPVEYGGPGFSSQELVIFQEEMMAADAPGLRSTGINMVGPLIMRYGTDWQKEYYLPKIPTQEHLWCQGFSEPDTGSDLASLSTEAVLNGDEFVINGKKIWTSYANKCNMMFLLVRTKTCKKKQDGITFLLMEMDQPGVEVQPIKLIIGESEFCESFFTNARTHKRNVIGEIDQGWKMAKALLGNERVGILDRPNLVGINLNRLRAHAEKVIIGGKKLSDDPIFRRRLTEFEMDQACARFTNNRIRESISKGIAPGPEAAFMKLYSTELGKKINDTMMGVMGPESQVFIDENNSGDELEVSRIFLFAYASTIAAGSSEILRNIISKRILGLPGN
ncbi:MAG: acyl-CoA dehydrogenase family protein [Thermodesulfobacteriota bacterium]|nr:acyl-CoA dehydrogenase family protein [Thermodesulfobacteriota bacterium]